jgi:hypothetical protein
MMRTLYSGAWREHRQAQPQKRDSGVQPALRSLFDYSVKRLDLATIDLALLKLKRTVLSEKLKEFKAGLDIAVKKEKARTEQDLNSKGLANFTVLLSALQAIERLRLLGLRVG